jgi:sugar lactone lactonase YvrE
MRAGAMLFRSRTAAMTVAVIAFVGASFVMGSASATTWHFNPGISGSMVVGPDGAMYISDSLNAFIDRVDATGHVSVVAGVGPPSPGGSPSITKDHGWTEETGYTGDGGPAVDAQLSFPVGLAFDARGDLYVADHGNDVIRKIDTNGIITTVAGVGPSDPFVKGQWVPGLQPKGGDGGPATQGVLESPWGITFDALGNLYIADRDHDAIREVDTNGVISTVAGTGQRGYSGDGGPAIQAKLNRPLNVVFDAAGNMYIADENNARIRKVDTNGIIRTIGGTGSLGCSGDGGAATAAPIQNPNDIGFGPDGSLYIAEGECHVVRRIDAQGIIRPVVGTGGVGCSGFGGGAALSALLSDPGSLTFDPKGNLYVSEAVLDDGGCGVILQIDGAGKTHVFSANPPA